MANEIDIVFPGEPIPQPRPTADGRGKFIRMVSAKAGSPVIPFKAAIRDAAKEFMYQENRVPLAVPLLVEIDAVWDRTERDKSNRKLDGGRRLWRGNGADADNVAKAVLDALNGLFWEDDSQIAGLTVRKFYGRLDESAHVRVIVRSLVVEGMPNGKEKSVRGD